MGEWAIAIGKSWGLLCYHACVCKLIREGTGGIDGNIEIREKTSSKSDGNESAAFHYFRGTQRERERE